MKRILTILILSLLVNLNAQVWQVIEGSDMPLPVYGGEAVVVDSLIYILGGYSDSLNTNINLIQEYNPQTNSWRIADTMNTPRYGFIAGNFQDSIIIMGGVELSLLLDSSLEIWNLNNIPYVFDLRLDFIRTFAAGLIHNNILYVFGGNSINLLSTYMFEYSIPDSTFLFRNNFGFIPVPPLNQYPFQQMSALTGNSVFLFGGVFIATSRVIYKYDIQNRTLDLLQTELTQSRTGGTAVSSNDSTIYIIGGFNESALSLSSVEVFQVNSGGFLIEPGPQLNFERSELMAVGYNNSIYVFGGKDDSDEPVRKVEKLDFLTDIENEKSLEPGTFVLYPNYPNPFNPSTNINFYLPSRSLVNLKVYNLAGEEIVELINEEMDAGLHSVIFDTSVKDISSLSSGVYFYKLTSFNFSTQNTYIDTRKMLLLK